MIPSSNPARHLVCEGALCSCNMAAAPTAMKVVSHDRYYVHSSSGTDRPVVTTHENDHRALHFSSCLAGGQPAPCMPQLLWQIPVSQQRIALANGAYPLPDNATAQCLTKGGRLKILTHGQLPSGDHDAPGLYSCDHQRPADKCSLNFPQQLPRIMRIKGPEKVRQLSPTSWEVTFDHPPSSGDIDLLHWSLENDQGIAEATSHGAHIFRHRFLHDGHYILRVFSGEDSDIMLTQAIQVTPTGIICSQRTTRPGQSIRFTIADAEPTDIFRWEWTHDTGLHGTSEDTGPEIQLTFAQPGHYVVRATTGDQTWQQPVTISNNQIQNIQADRKPVSGAVITFHITSTFPDLTEREQLKLHWKLEGPESTHCAGETTFRHLFIHCGHYTLYAYLYNLQQEAVLRFEVKNATVISAQWTTPNGYVIRQAGHDQDVCLYFEHTGLEKRKVLLEIYARQAFYSKLVHSQTIQITTAPVVSLPLSVSSLRQQLPSGWDNQQLQLYFQIKATDNIPIEQQSCPQLLLHRRQCIVKAYFTDLHDQRIYFITDHHQQMALKIYAVNLAGQQLQVTLLRRKGSPPLQRPLTLYPTKELLPLLEKDTIINKQQIVIDKTGTALLPVPLESLSGISLIYALIQLPGFNAAYSQQLFVYPGQQLRLSPAVKARSTAVIERVSVSQDESACQSLVWGSKVSCAFRKKVISIARKLQADPNHLMTCMAFETGGSFLPHLLNGYKPGTTPAVEKLTEGVLAEHAVGLVQFTQTAVDHINNRWKLKTTKKKLSQMSAEEQLDYVYHYLREFRGRLKSLEDFYLTILKPESVGKTEDHIVFSEEQDITNKRSWYKKNKGLDIDKDGIVYKKEVQLIIFKKYTEGLSYRNGCSLSCPMHMDAATPKNEWHHPLSDMQLRGWYNCWAPERSKFGVISERKSGKHQGLDLYAPEGTPVYACVNGEIISSYYSDSYGNALSLHGEYNGEYYYFFYAHLKNASKCNVGDHVKKGDIIGFTGKTGNAKSIKQEQEHLHFEIRTKETVGRGFDGRVDPLEIIKELRANEIINPQKELQYAKSI
ncbi:peptidoglycan DD-metalloendopeptidase family protein [Chitinophaga varians]|uniref:peptidoglycan DD-metalloendopeptidase family protein n=1 Tax=Chitinophaga varians TaxID=2202339 RepID=UPI00165F807B|nr:peptidoglycan DD-metalloendopeptidase family protein [Chitinophaga varians]MBC9913524.1 peptidoglycan DD-metalloendopeptidase family protein [Chitinophaga varians]